jgi:DNA-binding IclR family transcriptional regulator
VAVAAPIFSGNGEVAGSLGIFGPSVRIAEARVRQLAEIVQKEASAIGRELGRVA